MANLFAGLENLGLDGLDSNDVFKDEKKQEEAKEEKHELTEEEKEAREEDFIFDKSYTCPVCDNDFTTLNNMFQGKRSGSILAYLTEMARVYDIIRSLCIHHPYFPDDLYETGSL